MKILISLLVITLLICQLNALNGGTNAAAGQFPSFVAVFVPTNIQVCGGTILNENHVLTLTSCMLTATNQLIPANQVTILSGTVQLNFGLPRLNSRAIYVHPQYSPFTFDNDIAVIRTQINFNFPITPNPLLAARSISDRIVFDTFQCQLAAWNRNNSLQQTIIAPIINRDQCTELPLNFGRITERMVCAGIVTAGAGVCAHNVGGILFCNNEITGILNSGYGCGQPNNPGVYIQVRHYSQWIREQMLRQDIPAGNSFPLERLP
jgi:secreted trypsin-like serine protease